MIEYNYPDTLPDHTPLCMSQYGVYTIDAGCPCCDYVLNRYNNKYNKTGSENAAWYVVEYTRRKTHLLSVQTTQNSVQRL